MNKCNIGDRLREDSLFSMALSCYEKGDYGQAQIMAEKLLATDVGHCDGWRLYSAVLGKKVLQFRTDNYNYQHVLRELIAAQEQLVAVAADSGAHMELITSLQRMANLVDTPMAWVEYREACEAYFCFHEGGINACYAEVLRHYANAFSYGVHEAFYAKQQGRVFDQAKLEKISSVELSMATNRKATEVQAWRLLSYVQAWQQSFQYQIQPSLSQLMHHGDVQRYCACLRDLGFTELFLARDVRLETSLRVPVPQYIAVFQNNTTFAFLRVSDEGESVHDGHNGLLAQFFRRFRRRPPQCALSYHTYFTHEVVLTSLSGSESSRQDAPKGHLIKCRGNDPVVQLQLHNHHVDELERRIEVTRMSLSSTELCKQEEFHSNRLLRYKKDHAFLTFSEYHRATNIESRLSYSAIIYKLADLIDEHSIFLA